MTDLDAAVNAVADCFLEAGIITNDQHSRLRRIVALKVEESYREIGDAIQGDRARRANLSWWQRLREDMWL